MTAIGEDGISRYRFSMKIYFYFKIFEKLSESLWALSCWKLEYKIVLSKKYDTALIPNFVINTLIVKCTKVVIQIIEKESHFENIKILSVVIYARKPTEISFHVRRKSIYCKYNINLTSSKCQHYWQWNFWVR